MSAPAGTLTYNTVVTCNAAGNSNGDATLIAAAFNGIIFNQVSGTAAVGSATGAAVTITWPQSGIKMANDLCRDFVSLKIANMAASLNATVTAIAAATQIVLT